MEGGIKISTPSQNSLELGKITKSEIWEIPEAISRTIIQKEDRERIMKVAQGIIDSKCSSIYIFGSGTSYHAGLVSTYWFSKLAKIPTHCELAPEFPYLIEPIIAKKHVSICISQSGESELTVYAAKVAQEHGSHVIGLTNQEKSTLSTITKGNTLITRAGKEESVMATKTYVTQLVILVALAVDLALLRGKITDEQHHEIWEKMSGLPAKVEQYLPQVRTSIRKIAPYFKFCRNSFVIGAGPDYANCMEAALKLKEGARIFSQAFSTAETPHGPITLLSDPRDAFVLCIIPRPEAINRHRDILKLIKRLSAKGVTILGIKNPDDIVPGLDIEVNIPKCSEIFQPIFSIIPVQWLVVEIATMQNMDCDRPQNLTKVSRL
ncbi:MAG: SIS domain-containing protein [Promethearchaeota archaeon]